MKGTVDPVVTIIEEATGERAYTLRISGTRFRPKVFAEGRYTIEVQGETSVKTIKGVAAGSLLDGELIDLEF